MPPAISQKEDQGGIELYPSISLITPATTERTFAGVSMVESTFRYLGLDLLSVVYLSSMKLISNSTNI